MENPNWLRLIVVGLVLAAMAFGYFLLSSKITTKNNKAQRTNVVETVQPSSTEVIAQASTSPAGSPSTPSAYTRIAQRTQGGIQTLPATGSPLFLIGIFASSAIVTGFSLRKFPN